jgi:acyl-CoA dehydrogenase
MDFTIPSELIAVRDTVRRFVQRELVPLERQYPDGMPYEEELRWRKRVRDMGLFMMHTPEEYGGSGINMLGMALVFEETAKTTMAADFLLGIDQPDPVLLLASSSSQVRDRYMMPAVRGEVYWAFAMSEPGAGSDAQSITTHAVRDGDDWVINGTKLWSSRMRIADFAVVLVVTDKQKRGRGGMSMFIVDKDNPGMKVSRMIRTMGEEPNDWRGPTEVSFVNCRVPGWALVGAEGQGFKQAQARLGMQRISIASRCIGTADRALDGDRLHQGAENVGRTGGQPPRHPVDVCRCGKSDLCRAVNDLPLRTEVGRRRRSANGDVYLQARCQRDGFEDCRYGDPGARWHGIYEGPAA